MARDPEIEDLGKVSLPLVRVSSVSDPSVILWTSCSPRDILMMLVESGMTLVFARGTFLSMAVRLRITAVRDGLSLSQPLLQCSRSFLLQGFISAISTLFGVQMVPCGSAGLFRLASVTFALSS